MGTGTSKIVNLYAGTGIDLQFKGIAEPSTDPGQPINPEYWIADGPGNYVNFDGLIVTGDIAFLVFDGQSWTKTEFSIGDNNHATFDNVNSNRVFPGAVPAGKILQMIIIENHTANIAQLSMGKFAGSVNVFGGEAINPSDSTVIFFKPIYNRSAATDIYIHNGSEGDMWNGSNLKITFVFVKI